MPRPRVYVTRHLPGHALDYLSAQADVDVWEGELPPPRKELLEQARSSDAMLTMLTDRIDGALLGIIGMGGIGQEVAKRARGFSMRIVYFSRTRKPSLEGRYRMQFVSQNRLLKEADIVTLHAPLTLDTRHLIGAKQLRAMKRTAVLVNTARGPLVDQAALYEALRDRRIAAAALDVADPEPIAPDDPLLRLDNVIVTPHIASASVATRSQMAMLAAHN